MAFLGLYKNIKEPVNLQDIEKKYGQIVLSLFNDVESGYNDMEDIVSDYPEAAIMLGQYYAQFDSEKAMNFFKIAADAGIQEGLWGYSGYIRHNRIPQENNIQDQLWKNAVVAAAEGGCADAMNEAGNIYSRLNDYFLSAYWYGLAEIYEHPQAVYGCR